MTASRWSEDDEAALAAEVGTTLLRDPEARRTAGEDFGQLARGDAWGVVCPRDIGELTKVVALAARRRLSLTVRGRGYSQSGQSLPTGGVSLDCSRLDRIDPIDLEASALIAHCEGGTRWRELFAMTARSGLVPAVLPLNLDMSVGGLLSAGGIGASSHRFGPVVANVTELEVVTGTGARLRCSTDEHRELFDAVRSGLGRCAVVARAGLALRKMAPRVRTFQLLYGSIDDWLDDQQVLVRSGHADYLEGFCWAIGGHWLYALHLGIEYAEPDAPSAPAGLRHHGEIRVDDATAVDFATRYQPRFDGMRSSGSWGQLHPWLECLLPADRASQVISEVLSALPPSLGNGCRLTFVARRGLPPLFAVPDAGEIVCFAILPTGVPAAERDVALDALRMADRLLLAAGGKRYLSGWLFDPSDAGWRAHFGAAYDGWMAAKRRYDPECTFRSVLLPAAER